MGKNKKKTLYRNCPLTVSRDIIWVGSQGGSLPEDYFFPNEYNLVQSDKTGLIFADVEINESVLNSHYSKDAKYDPQIIKSLIQYPKHDIERYNLLFESCKKYINSQSKILDIGFGNGGLFNVFLNKGVMIDNLFGLDPSPVSHTLAKSVYNINTFLGTIDDIKNYNTKFDFIILSHVVEHLLNPKQQINGLLKSLTLNGKVYIEVPNAKQFHKYADVHGPYQEINTEHINHFSEKSLKNLAHFSGFKCIESCERIVINEAGYYPVIHQIWEKGLQQFEYDGEIVENIKFYLDKSEKIFNNQLKIIKNNAPVFLYGIVEFSYKILANIDNKYIKGLIDISSKKIGKKINNIQITSPTELKRFKNEKIFISSFVSKKQIKEDLLSINKDLLIL